MAGVEEQRYGFQMEQSILAGFVLLQRRLLNPFVSRVLIHRSWRGSSS